MTKRVLTNAAIRRYVAALVLGLWLVCMGLLTAVTVHSFYSRFLYFGSDYSDQYQPDHYHLNAVTSQQPGWRESNVMFYLADKASFSHAYYGFGETFWNPLARDAVDYSRAQLLLDENGKVEFQSGDYLFFAYSDEETWSEGKDDDVGFAYIAIEDREKYAALLEYFGEESLGWRRMMGIVSGLRVRGWLEGNKLHPVRVDCAQLNHAQAYEHSLCWGDTYGYVSWHTVFEETEAFDEPLVTLYTHDPRLILYEEDGTLANSLAQWAEEEDEMLYTGGAARCTVYSKSAYSGGTAYSAVTCSPLWEGVKALRYVYLGSFALAVLGLVLLMRVIRRNLSEPLQRIQDAITYGHSRPSLPGLSRWQEVDAMERYIITTNQALSESKAECKRLNTALEFARSAEEKRRTMVSNITHELKTPLAIIHSYAEGLKEGIAGEQRERYQDVILEEAERMDAMVLEMLDHSRLEAGKVHLSLSTVSLTELTTEVFEKLRPSAEAKGLQVRLSMPKAVIATADEARMEQVIRNFATNAIKYTPEGGLIRVGVYGFGSEAVVSVENECQPISDEVLSRVWDSFYRADNVRSGREGTGLGLSIAKSIISLHRGRCDARRTETGVEFRFTIPM